MARRIKRLRIEVESIINRGLFDGIKPAISFQVWNNLCATYGNSPMPEDVKFVSMQVDPMRPGYLYVYLESEEWPEVDYKKEIEDIPILIYSHYQTHASDLGEPLSKPQQQTISSQSIDTIVHEEVPESSLPVEKRKSSYQDQQELGSREHH